MKNWFKAIYESKTVIYELKGLSKWGYKKLLKL